MAKPLIIGASEFELAPLRNTAAEKLGLLLGSGVGSLQSAATIGSWLSSTTFEINCCVFIGSCGSYATQLPGGHLPIGAAVCCTSTLLGDLPLLRGDAYLPESVAKEIGAALPLVEIVRSVGAVPAKIATTTAITSSAEVGAEISRLSGALCENLELFGVATICAARKIPWTAISVVTNHVGPNAHSDWQTNYVQAADKTAQFVLRMLPSLLHLP